MLKKFLHTSKLSLIVGLCLYGAANQTLRASQTTYIRLPDGIIFDDSYPTMSSIVKKYDNKMQREWWEGMVTLVATDEADIKWKVSIPVRTRPKTAGPYQIEPQITRGAVKVLNAYTKLTVLGSPSMMYWSYNLAAKTEAKVNDPNWTLNETEGETPKIETYLSSAKYPYSSTKVTVDAKSNSFRVTED